MKAVSKMLDEGKAKPVLYEPIYESLDAISRGLDDLDKRKTWGKAVVRVKQDELKANL